MIKNNGEILFSQFHMYVCLIITQSSNIVMYVSNICVASQRTSGISDIAIYTRAGQESKLSENVPRQLNSDVKLNFKAGLFSSI